jgi:Flp pilus assembly protein TadB
VTGLVVKWTAIALAAGVVLLIGIVVLEEVWLQVGLGAALLVICIPLLIWAWLLDRKEKTRRQDLEDI